MRDEARFHRGGLPARPPKRFASTHETALEAAKRLGISSDAIRQRLRYGWTEEQALTLPKGAWHRLYPKNSMPKGARPGVKLSPLTRVDLVVLRCLADGITPRKIYESGLTVSLHALYLRMDRMRLKLNAFTTAEMVAVALRRGFIK